MFAITHITTLLNFVFFNKLSWSGKFVMQSNLKKKFKPSQKELKFLILTCFWSSLFFPFCSEGNNIIFSIYLPTPFCQFKKNSVQTFLFPYWEQPTKKKLVLEVNKQTFLLTIDTPDLLYRYEDRKFSVTRFPDIFRIDVILPYMNYELLSSKRKEKT